MTLLLTRHVVARSNNLPVSVRSGDSMEVIAMPRHSLARCKAQTAHHRGSVVEHDFINHF